MPELTDKQVNVQIERRLTQLEVSTEDHGQDLREMREHLYARFDRHDDYLKDMIANFRESVQRLHNRIDTMMRSAIIAVFGMLVSVLAYVLVNGAPWQ